MTSFFHLKSRAGTTRRATALWPASTAVGLALLAAVLTPGPLRAQEDAEASNPCMVLLGDTTAFDQSASGPIGEHELLVCYADVAARGRPVFGHSLAWADTRWMVQLDQLWNTGVVLSTPVALDLAGLAIGPGVYGLLAIPGSFEWLVLPTTDVDAFSGSGEVPETAIVGRTLVRATATTGYVEHLTARTLVSGVASTDLIVEWERSQARIPLRLAGARGGLACQFRGDPERLATRGSPLDSVDVALGGGTVRVCYGAPSARERTVFGGLVPYDDMWRTGANEPTVLHAPFPVEVAGIALEAGDYTLLTIPSRGDWVVVINGSTNQWGRVTPTEAGGLSRYSEDLRAQEVGRALVPSESMSEHIERFRIRTETGADGAAELLLEWERTRARIPIRAR